MLDAPQQLLNRVNPRVVYQQVRWRLAFQGLVRLLQPLATPLVIAEDLGCAGVHTTYPDAPIRLLRRQARRIAFGKQRRPGNAPVKHARRDTLANKPRVPGRHTAGHDALQPRPVLG